MDKPLWRCIGVLNESTDSVGKSLERALNRLEDEGYDVRDPLPIGETGHFLVYGRVLQKTRRKRGDSMPPSSRG